MRTLLTIIASLLASIFLVIFFARYPINGFLISKNKDLLILEISKQLENNPKGFSFEAINSKNDWDTICIIPPYSYEPLFSPYSIIRDYYGKNSNHYRIFIPNPTNRVYGIGFSFLKDEDLLDILHIPMYKLSLSYDKGVITKPTTFNVNGNTIPLHSVTFDIYNNQKCFQRGSTYITINKNQVLKVKLKNENYMAVTTPP